MGVDLQTYRCRVGRFYSTLGFSMAIKSTCPVHVTHAVGLKYAGLVICIGMILIIGGIEQNPGPFYTGQIDQDMKKPQFRNWVRAALSFQHVKCGIQSFMEDAISRQHGKFLKDPQFHKSKAPKCSACSLETLFPEHERKSCFHRIKSRCFCRDGNRTRCPNGFCSIFHDLVLKAHLDKYPLWINTNPRRWFEDSWELGKCFLSSTGYINVDSARNMDASGLLSIAINNSYLHLEIEHIAKFEKCREIRNDIFHTTTYEVTDKELEDYLSLETSLLQDKCFKNYVQAEEAISQLKQLMGSVISQSEAFEIVSKSDKEKVEQIIKGVRGELIKLYRHYTTKTEISPLLPQDQINVDEVYVPISAEINQINTKDSRNKEIMSLENVFHKEVKRMNTIFVTADPGMGKTILCRKLASMWCTAHENDEILEDLNEGYVNDETKQPNATFSCCQIFSHGKPDGAYQADIRILRQFALLFIISMKDLQKEQYIEDMVCNQVLKRISDNQDIVNTLLQSPNHKCLIILDGIDEWVHFNEIPNSPNISKGLPLRKREFQYCTIYTTRPWKLESVRPKSYEFEYEIRILELCNNSYEALIKRMENVLHERGFPRFSKDFYSLEHFPKNPLLLKLVTCLYMENKQLPASLNGLYGGVLDLIFMYAPERNSADEPFLTKFNNPPECNYAMPSCIIHLESLQRCKHLLKCVGEIAFKSLFCQKGTPVIRYLDMMESDKENVYMCLKIGILSQDKCTTSLIFRKMYRTILHKSFEEFLAAFYIAVNPNEEVKKTIIDVCSSAQNILEMSKVFQFLSGLYPNVMDQLFESFGDVIKQQLQHDNENQSRQINRLTHMLIDCMAERKKCGFKLSQPYYLCLSDRKCIALPAFLDDLNIDKMDNMSSFDFNTLNDLLNFNIDPITVLTILKTDFTSWTMFEKLRPQCLVRLDATSVIFSEAQFILLLSAPKLECVKICKVNIIDKNDMKTQLSFENENLQEINHCNIIDLFISHTDLSKTKIFHITKQPNLRVLQLKSTIVTKRQMGTLLKSPNLERLVYDGLFSTKNDAASEIFVGLNECRNIKWVTVINVDMKDTCLLLGSKMQQLKTVDIENINTNVGRIKQCISSMLQMQQNISVKMKSVGLNTDDADVINTFLNEIPIKLSSFVKKMRDGAKLSRNYKKTDEKAHVFDCSFEKTASSIEGGTTVSDRQDSLEHVEDFFMGVHDVHVKNIVVTDVHLRQPFVQMLESSIQCRGIQKGIRGILKMGTSISDLSIGGGASVEVFDGLYACLAFMSLHEKGSIQSPFLTMEIYRNTPFQ